MTFKIEKGKRHVRRDGVITGPIVPNNEGDEEWRSCWTWMDSAAPHNCWTDDGQFLPHLANEKDIVSVVTDEPAPQEAGPVRTETVTRMVIVPGDYEVYCVTRVHPTGVNLSIGGGLFDASDLRKFARGLVSMAEALEEKP